MPDSFNCRIVTPAEAVFDGEVTYASVPAWDGQLGVISQQSPLLTRLAYAGLRLDLVDGSSRWYLVEGGFAQVRDDGLTILTERATPADRLSVEEAEAELTVANQRAVAPGESRADAEKDQQRRRSKRALARAGG